MLSALGDDRQKPQSLFSLEKCSPGALGRSCGAKGCHQGLFLGFVDTVVLLTMEGAPRPPALRSAGAQPSDTGEVSYRHRQASAGREKGEWVGPKSLALFLPVWFPGGRGGLAAVCAQRAGRTWF